MSLGVFGSVGRGTPNATSDVDVLVVAEELPRGRMAPVGEFDAVDAEMEWALRSVRRAQARLRVLGILLDEGDYSDVVREAQEAVELALKALLRAHGVEPLKFHDVSTQLEENKGRFAAEVAQELPRLKAISQWLRREREFSFCGDIDLIPSEQYSVDDARRALADAQFVIDIVAGSIGRQ